MCSPSFSLPRLLVAGEFCFFVFFFSREYFDKAAVKRSELVSPCQMWAYAGGDAAFKLWSFSCGCCGSLIAAALVALNATPCGYIALCSADVAEPPEICSSAAFLFGMPDEAPPLQNDNKFIWFYFRSFSRFVLRSRGWNVTLQTSDIYDILNV